MYKVNINRRLLLERRIQEDKNALVRALKADDAEAAKKALTGMSGEDLRLTRNEFNGLLVHIDKASKPATAGSREQELAMDAARKMLSVGKDDPQKSVVQSDVDLTPQELEILRESYKPSAIGLKSFNYGNLVSIYEDLTYESTLDRDPIYVSLRMKIKKHAQQAWPKKYKDVDFP